MDNTNLVLDIIVSILLAATIFATVTVNRRLNQLRESRDDLPRLLGAFNDATVRAEAGIPKLRRAAEEASVIVQERVEKAQLLRDDLAFMVERADSIANRLEDAVRQARAELKSSAPSSAGRLHAASPAAGPLSSSAPPAAPPASAFAPQTAPSAAPRPLTAIHPDEDDSFGDDRSEAERELLRALQAVR